MPAEPETPWQRTVAGAAAAARYALRNAYLMSLLARDRRVPWSARGVAAGAAGYVFFPFDMIPDYFPVVGCLDDVGVVWLGLWFARRLVPAAVLAEHRAAAERLFPDGCSPLARWRRDRSVGRARPVRAFGVDPSRRQFYSLRQSRYDALAQDISDRAGAVAAGEKLRLLIVGCGVGTELRHLEAKPHFEKLAISGANLDAAYIYRREAYEQLFIGDLTQGYPQMAANAFDVVVCEQVLEHLDRIDVAIATLARVLKPAGRAIVGVPVFPPPLHLLREHIVPRLDAMVSRRRSRGHRQAFSMASFLAVMRAHSGLKLLQVRGFRVVSGGALRWLDNYRWWWRLNRRLGERIPGVCIEVQAILEKRGDRDDGMLSEPA